MKAWPTPGAFPILAHQGGWDEMLMVLGPLVLVGGALWLANRRVTRQLAEQEASQPVDGEANPESGPDRIPVDADPDTA